MEAYSHSHSRPHSRVQATTIPATFTGNNAGKKPPIFPNNGGFFTTSYQDVYGGPPRYATLAPLAEDYSEIFASFRSSSSSRASSIPVLDLPAVADVDSGVSFFDYSEVFGGFNAVGFAVHYDELFRPFDGGDDSSSDEAWTPVGSGSLSDDSDPFALSEKSQCLSHEKSHQPLDAKQFNVSFHKINLENSTCVPNMTHMSQLSAVSGYTCVVDETASLREMGAQRLCSEIVDDTVFDVEPLSIMPQGHKRNIVSEVSLDDSALKSFDSELMHGRACAASMSHVNSTSASAYDIDARTKPSHVQPLSELHPKRDVDGLSSGFSASHSSTLEPNLDARIPPCFGMEMDASYSTTAIKKVMEKAQTKLKAPKELMGGKKDGLQDTSKMGLKTDVNGVENVPTVLNECAFGDNRAQRVSGKEPAKMKNSGKSRHALTASQILLDISAIDQPKAATGKSDDGKYEKECSLPMDTVFAEGDGVWEKATQYYEFVTNDNTRLVPQPPCKGDGKTAGFKQQSDDDEHYSDSTEEGFVAEGNRWRLKATQAVSRKEYYEKLVKVAKEVHDNVISGHVETDQRLTGMSQGNYREQNARFGYEPEKYVEKISQVLRAGEEKSVEATWNEEARIRSKNVIGEQEVQNKETKKEENEIRHLEQNDGKTYGPHQSQVKEFPEWKEGETLIKESYERVESDRRVQNIIPSAEDEEKVQAAYGRQKENKLADAIKRNKEEEKRELMEKWLKEPFVDGFGGNELQAACRSQENGKTKDLKEKVDDKRSKEAFLDVFDGERLQRTCEVRGRDKRNDLLQRDEDGKDVNGRGPERILEECVELEEHWKYNEAPEQVVRKPREGESYKLASGNEKSREGLNCENNEEKLEKVADQGAVESKHMQLDEMDESPKILRRTGDAEYQEAVHSSHIEIECEDEGQKSDSSSKLKHPVENGKLKSPVGANIQGKNFEVGQDTLTSKLKNQPTGEDCYQDVFAQEADSEISSVVPEIECKLKAVDTGGVLVDKEPTEFTATPGSLNRHGNNSKSGEACDRFEQSLKEENKEVPQSVSDPNLVKDSNLEQTSDQEEKVKTMSAEGNDGWNEHAGKGEPARTVMTERDGGVQKRFHPPNISQNSEPKGKITDQSYSMEEKNEKEIDREGQFRKLEEEREREREREKDRMAVEIGIRETRERAYASARDQAERAGLERATAEARQRAMTEARERLEKACAEARQRSLADKEARLQAERAAVERANAETRQRALEKEMAEKTTFEARERVQRSVSEKYTTEKDVVMRQSSMPSMHGETFEATGGEPVQRCRARLERHHRTVERVAKALADKNMRDLLAQREQAERRRLAETLDADIKRWSSGKEGNLRALLSTLQYILGPNSGWQPIPLTEVITAAGVKKAYRKATLYVHPDKLQQRGASIQQKYICEKIFDLLKEAWSRFNSEEK